MHPCLKCRTRSQEVDMQFQKVYKTCLKQHGGQSTDTNDDSMSSDDESSEGESSQDDSSSEKIFYDKHIFYSNNDRSSYRNQSMNNQRNSAKQSSVHVITNRNYRDYQNTKQNRNGNRGDSWNSRDSRNKKDDFNNGDSRYDNNTDYEKAVDQKGFPERDSVIPLMNQDIRDTELKDFVEESITECFRYLESNKKDKCEFSQNLLKCLAEKGQQNCEDWELKERENLLNLLDTCILKDKDIVLNK